jgi:protein-tyrosine phosphatase
MKMTAWWIDEPVLLGTSNPTTEQLTAWYGDGFRTVISFLEEATQPPAYDVSVVQAMGYERCNIPLHDGPLAPDLSQYEEFTRIVDENLKRGGVIIHCMAGRGRTGAMAVAYWIGKGLSADQAIAKMHEVNPIVQFPIIRASLDEFERTRRR